MTQITIRSALSTLLLLSLAAGVTFALDLQPVASTVETSAAAVAETPDLLGIPEAVLASGCTAEHDCGDGNVVSCTGTSTCSQTIPGVECDGVQTQCPNHCTVAIQCSFGLKACWSTSGNCVQSPPSCNGRPLQCGHGPF